MSEILYQKNVFSTPFLSGYRELKIPILDTAGNSAWPAVFPIARINKLRTVVGPRHFSAQMMLEYVPAERIRLDPGGIKFYGQDFDSHFAKIGEHHITGAAIYWDPSTGRRNADHSVCVLVYRDDNNRRVFIHDILYILVPDGTEYPLAYQCETVLNFVRRYKMRGLSVETNGIGNALPEIMRNITRGAGYSIQINHITNSRRKEDRILDALEPLLSTGRLYAHERISSTPFISEMLAWTPMGGTEHDDGLDAVAGAIACTPTPIHPNGIRAHKYIANTDFQI